MLFTLSSCTKNKKDNQKPKKSVDINEEIENKYDAKEFIFDDLIPYDGNKIRIAFIGDSITYGWKSEDPLTMSYPAQLNEMMNNHYTIGNFGKNAAYVLPADSIYNAKADQPDRSYKNTKEYLDSKEFNPDVVVIMLGTNDVKSVFEKDDAKEAFKEAYLDLINDYQELESVKKIYIATSIMNHYDNAIINIGHNGMIQELQMDVAKISDLEAIDIYNKTKDVLEDISYFDDDKLHLNQKGYRIIADAFYDFFRK